MGWFTRFTRFGDMHLVYSQEGDNACGIACVRMVTFKVNKLSAGRTALHSETELDAVYSRVSNTTYDGSAYTYANHLATVLTELCPGTWTAGDVGASAVGGVLLDGLGGADNAGTGVNGAAPAVRRGYPIIVLVGWGAGGAHFVVVDTVHQWNGALYASVCDPWDGDVHVTRFARGAPFAYTGQDQSLTHAAPGQSTAGAILSNLAAGRVSWSTGASEHGYAAGASSGAGNGWVVRRTA